MTDQERQEILEKAKEFFTDTIAERHVQNTLKCKDLKEFNVNPFLSTYLANYAFGDGSPKSIAKALIYPRILGTSITTSFGTNMQNFCNIALSSFASLIQGVDIQFEDALDGRQKYCQIKAGPNTINKDDVTTIVNHFKDVKNLARTNRHMEINPSIDCIVGVLYGEPSDLSAFYQTINSEYPVICGKNFWHRLTGDEDFYTDLIETFATVAIDIDGTELIQDTINKLAEQIQNR